MQQTARSSGSVFAGILFLPMLWHERGDVGWLREVSRDLVSGVDVETTGLDPRSDEILQIAVVYGDGSVAINALTRSARHQSWPRAEAIHGITPEMVKGAPPIADVSARVAEALGGADLLVGYNLVFDIAFLEAAGIALPTCERFDVMREFAPVANRRVRGAGGNRSYRFQTLEACAKRYGYVGSPGRASRPHDALNDTQAALHCFYAMLEDDGSRYARAGQVPYLDVVVRRAKRV